MTKCTLFSIVALCLLSSAGIAQNLDTPCACPQWMWAMWSNGGNSYYSYYSKVCDGEYEYWASLDSATDYGAYPGGDCTNQNGCSPVAVIQVTEGKLGAKKGDAAPPPSVHAVQKNEPGKPGLAGRGANAKPGPAWDRSAVLRTFSDGGATLVSGPTFLRVEVENPGGQIKPIDVKVYAYQLNPPANMSGDYPRKDDQPEIVVGTGVEVKEGETAATIGWDAVETVSPDKTGAPTPPKTTHCIRFMYEGVSYQIITTNQVKMKS